MHLHKYLVSKGYRVAAARDGMVYAESLDNTRIFSGFTLAELCDKIDNYHMND